MFLLFVITCITSNIDNKKTRKEFKLTYLSDEKYSSDSSLPVKEKNFGLDLNDSTANKSSHENYNFVNSITNSKFSFVEKNTFRFTSSNVSSQKNKNRHDYMTLKSNKNDYAKDAYSQKSIFTQNKSYSKSEMPAANTDKDASISTSETSSLAVSPASSNSASDQSNIEDDYFDDRFSTLINENNCMTQERSHSLSPISSDRSSKCGSMDIKFENNIQNKEVLKPNLNERYLRTDNWIYDTKNRYKNVYSKRKKRQNIKCLQKSPNNSSSDKTINTSECSINLQPINESIKLDGETKDLCQWEHLVPTQSIEPIKEKCFRDINKFNETNEEECFRDINKFNEINEEECFKDINKLNEPIKEKCFRDINKFNETNEEECFRDINKFNEINEEECFKDINKLNELNRKDKDSICKFCNKESYLNPKYYTENKNEICIKDKSDYNYRYALKCNNFCTFCKMHATDKNSAYGLCTPCEVSNNKWFINDLDIYKDNFILDNNICNNKILQCQCKIFSPSCVHKKCKKDLLRYIILKNNSFTNHDALDVSSNLQSTFSYVFFFMLPCDTRNRMLCFCNNVRQFIPPDEFKNNIIAVLKQSNEFQKVLNQNSRLINLACKYVNLKQGEGDVHKMSHQSDLTSIFDLEM